MKLHTAILPIPFVPNPRVVRMALAEKGVKVDLVDVDVRTGANRADPYLSLNPAGELPALELDDGRVLAESVAIAEYFDELHPNPPLIGTTPEERALTRMWLRRVDLRVVVPLTWGFRAAEGLPMFKERVRCLPEAAEGLKAAARDGMAWFDAQLGERAFLTGDQLRLPDITLYCFIDFGAKMNQPMPEGLPHLKAWFERMAARPSAKVMDAVAQPA